MRKWRAENREKNRQNDLRCRVYRLARQKFGEHDSIEKQAFVREEISRRLGRRMFTSHHEAGGGLLDSLEELPFYSAPQQKIELPSIQSFQRSDSWSSDDMLPPLSPCMRRRTSSSSISSLSSITSGSQNQEDTTVLPPMQTILNYVYNVKYVEPARILDEFVGVILNYAQDETMAT
ncbi:uncharacterized protein BYT42DRAFT_503697 [Radiomyces spectabilis]|uniref:uncharacterized protein n=1 Tax=Radiomyces spectabilis TaxID=64574 RepID=UPI00221EB084|nr:uncharacterized protein BYT42DRAFT_503697 [Radiomyces spectabilis]KAI8368279.1 hypothetical protein BYT42DRAFT_503697 [Radiomyces spectabilis]